MALKLLLDSLDGVEESQKGLYEERDGKFHLMVEGIEDTGALKRAKDHEKKQRKEVEEKLRETESLLEEVQKKLDDNDRSKAKSKGDVEALEKSWQEKLTAREAELQGKIDSLTGNLETLLVDNEAVRMASELAVEGSADVLAPHIKARLAVDTRDGKHITVVKDADGKPSATTMEELKAEIASNEVFAPVVVGSKASGSGASGGNNGGGAASDIDWSTASPAEMAAAVKAKRATS